MKSSIFKAIALFLILMLVYTLSKAQDGKSLFKNNCSFCHSIGGGKVVGPDLKGVNALRSEDWLIKFIKNSSELIKSGDQDAIAIYNEYNKMPMPDHSHLNDNEIKAILAHIDEAGKLVPDQEVALETEDAHEVAEAASYTFADIFLSDSWQSTALSLIAGTSIMLVIITSIILLLTYRFILRIK